MEKKKSYFDKGGYRVFVGFDSCIGKWVAM